MTHFDILIVGAGHGGAQAAILLRQLGFEGSVGLVGAESELPYERPPLSKDYLASERPFERMLIRPAAFWPERGIELVPGRRIVAVDAAARAAASYDRSFTYGSMIWAAGGEPCRLGCSGGDLAGVHLVRSRADIDAVRDGLDRVHRIVVIGGGYIGLETAAVLNKLGKDVVLIEALDRVLARVAGPGISLFYETEHRARGVEIRLSQAVEQIEGENGCARAVHLASGERIQADMVIVGIGIAPAVGPLLAAGAEGGDGIHVDAHCRTSLPDIYAIGDCAAHENRFAGGRRIRLESVQNAHDQAAAAVKAILGQPEPYDAVPWFWSNQYDLKLQTVGLTAGYDATVLRGRPESRSFSLIYLREGRVIALDCVNAIKDYVQGRKLILDGTAPDPARLADARVPLKAL